MGPGHGEGYRDVLKFSKHDDRVVSDRVKYFPLLSEYFVKATTAPQICRRYRVIREIVYLELLLNCHDVSVHCRHL
jgi:hypothetical protein